MTKLLRIPSLLLIAFVCALPADAQNLDPFSVTIRSDEELRAGHVANLQFVLRNNTVYRLAVLAMRPEQPCEEEISLVNSIYGNIVYDEKSDQYIHQAVQQGASIIPVVEGFVLPGRNLTVDAQYRPYSSKEKFRISYVLLEETPIYAVAESSDPTTIFRKNGKDLSRLILPALSQLQNRSQTVVADMRGVTSESTGCYCEVLEAATNTLPPSLCKSWDTGKTAMFRVGDDQRGTGPDKRESDWKFLDQFQVYYGDGMHTHGEFVYVLPEEAKKFMDLVSGRFSMRKVSYFFDEHYYDLEEIP